jgi:hypothetical protein
MDQLRKSKIDIEGMTLIASEQELIGIALALLPTHAALSDAEQIITNGTQRCVCAKTVAQIRGLIVAGLDPLGDAFSGLRSAAVRRIDGATYTPEIIISSMVTWAASEGCPDRVVDAGAGSGRFLLAAGKLFPKAKLVAVEYDPLAVLILRANLTVVGFIHRTTILAHDYRLAPLRGIKGRTLFIGNPPYVRHHLISAEAKNWFADAAAKFKVKASKLAGLHIHFFVRTLELAQKGDYGVFITSSEWLDVNYGETLRKLLSKQLGGVAIHVIDPKAMPFDDATTTGTITCFRVGNRPDELLVQSVHSADGLSGLAEGRLVSWSEMEAAKRWSIIVKPGPAVPSGYSELGELCRVHRGAVTGNNLMWIAGDHTHELSNEVLRPAVTKARDLIAAGDVLDHEAKLRRVVDIPADLDELSDSARNEVKRFLRWAKEHGADQSYTARNRTAWWAVGLKAPAPIMCTYMARRAPAFVRNLCHARHINIAHGLYPRQPLSSHELDSLAKWLRTNVSVASGRTYAGGLTKFEPKEVERIPIPQLDLLFAMQSSGSN